jgi:hypothetical protein
VVHGLAVGGFAEGVFEEIDNFVDVCVFFL